MAESDGGSKRAGRGLSLPGQPTEEAVAEVGSEAGKSLVRGLGRLGSAWIAKREAKTEAARLAIETGAKIKADAALISARRENEIAEVEHQFALERRVARLRIELAREQMNLETIERRAIEYTESSSDNSRPREIDIDWLFKFADLAQKVSDRDVQSLWARALSSAAVETAPQLSATALQTLGLFDKESANGFRKFVAVIVRFGFVPHTPDGQDEPQQINMAELADLGLVQEGVRKLPYEFHDFVVEGKSTDLQAHVILTKRGYDIATAVFNDEDVLLNDDVEQLYLRQLLWQQVTIFKRFFIRPKNGKDSLASAFRVVRKGDSAIGVKRVNWTEYQSMLSPRVTKLLQWAEHDYEIAVQEPDKKRLS